MKTRRLLLFGSLIGAGIVTCAVAGDPTTPKAPAPLTSPKQEGAKPATTTNAPTTGNYPVIGYIEKQGQTVTIKAGPKGPVYSVKNAGGKILFENLSAEQLRAQAPELHDFIKTAVAGGAGKSGVVKDASARPATLDGRR